MGTIKNRRTSREWQPAIAPLVKTELAPPLPPLYVRHIEMGVCTIAEANALGLSDAAVVGIVWTNESRDLEFHLRLCSGSEAVLICCWFTNLRIDLDFKNLSESLTWEVRFTQLKNEIWHIEFDFGGAPEGIIALNCNEIAFRTKNCEQDGTGQPATRPVVEPEGGDKPQPEAEGRSR